MTAAASDPDKSNRAASTRTFIILIAIYAVVAGLSVFLPQGTAAAPAQPTELPASLPVLALANGLIVFVAYGGLGLLGLFFARKIGMPEIWDPAVTSRQRFLIPAITGAVIGAFLILIDVLFAPINGIGHIPHPPFPTSIVATLAAAIGEETLFRLFFITFWTWLISRVILRGRWQTPIYWIVSVFAAIAFAMSHLPGLMYLEGWNSMSQVPLVLIIELLLLNAALGMAAAGLFKKYGFLAAVGVHLWADVIWHVLYGLI